MSIFDINSSVGSERILPGLSAVRGRVQITKIGGCAGKTDAEGKFTCEADFATATGMVAIRAEAHDASGVRAGATIWGDPFDYPINQSVQDPEGLELQLVPEHSTVATGGTARAQVRMRFRKARVLITVEKDGNVVSSTLAHLEGNNPIVAVPVLPDYAPEFSISIVAIEDTRVLAYPSSPVGACSRWDDYTQSN